MRGTRGGSVVGVVAAVLVALTAGVGPAGADPSPAATAADGTSAVGGTITEPVPQTGVSGIPFSFKIYPFELRELGIGDRLFSGSQVVPKQDSGIHDSDGVRMRRVKGQLYDFPRGQANYGLDNLNSYRLVGDQFYLDRALAQADRLVSYHVQADGAWYFPTYPSRSRHGKPGEFIRAPYYSALPQGRILILFSRLAEMTGSDKWREAADRTFLAFLRPGPRSGPYILNVDSNGYYWLQEWPWPGMKPDDTLNGHNSSSFGLYEYYMVTGDARAAALFKGAATTIRHYLPKFRRDGWISCYCLAHRGANANYHNMHIGQLLTLYKMTGDLVFARAADAFSNDYPRPAVEGGLRVEPGAYNAIKVDAAGKVVARRTVTVRHRVTWRTDKRQRLWRRSPIYLHAQSGAAAGWWLPERAGKVFLIGMAAPHGYDPPRKLSIAAGTTLVALQFDDRGRVTARRRVSADDRLLLTVNRRAVLSGYDRVRVSGGDLTGYWLRLRRGVRLY